MIISIVSAIGKGKTELSAFDDALYQAGIANFNLILLSSIIPPRSEIRIEPHLHLNSVHFGDRLYGVLARKTTHNIVEEAWAGLGWVQSPYDGRGLFVEHPAKSESMVHRLISASLEEMIRRRDVSFTDVRRVVVGSQCTQEAVCALVAAVYRIEPW